jgi:hypothetical protein
VIRECRNYIDTVIHTPWLKDTPSDDVDEPAMGERGALSTMNVM